jgi:hypothetical protein
VPAWRKASWRDEPPSKRCVSAQPIRTAAIASKLTESAAAEAATVSADSRWGGGGQDKKTAMTISNLAAITYAH